jgi:hypothetical protein
LSAFKSDAAETETRRVRRYAERRAEVEDLRHRPRQQR